MKDVIIAFDCDGTLIDNGGKMKAEGEINQEMVALLKILAKLKNVYIIIWSGGGQEWADLVARRCGIRDIVAGCHSKIGYDHHQFGEVSIAFDDVETFKMAKINLILHS